MEAQLDQAAVALERGRLAGIATNARARGQTEALRTAALTSLGHDLRAPLTTISGAAETLRTAGAALSEATCADLLASIEEAATRLARRMSAILDMVRLEAGQVVPRRVVRGQRCCWWRKMTAPASRPRTYRVSSTHSFVPRTPTALQ
ncbi:MAG: hypothetical protein K5Q68_16520 [Roseococcus sp.]|nr:hypothetical protein [Roseococcus sp.]